MVRDQPDALTALLRQVEELAGAGGRGLDREHVAHGDVLARPAHRAPDHHVEGAEAGRGLVLVADQLAHVAVPAQHQLLLQLLVLQGVQLVRLHHGAGPEARHLPGARVNAVQAVLEQNLCRGLLLLLLLLLLRLISLTMTNPCCCS